jgi:hypothetical protein
MRGTERLVSHAPCTGEQYSGELHRDRQSECQRGTGNQMTDLDLAAQNAVDSTHSRTTIGK